VGVSVRCVRCGRGGVADVARQEVLSRFQRLRAADVWEKTAGDLVTSAELAAERRLAEELCGLVAGSVFVGEEGVAADGGSWIC
jgi:fructose-1,6-bisphosphatase/inositol monophosphatase family enzyme